MENRRRAGRNLKPKKRVRGLRMEKVINKNIVSSEVTTEKDDWDLAFEIGDRVAKDLKLTKEKTRQIIKQVRATLNAKNSIRH